MMKPTSEAELSDLVSGLTGPVQVKGGGTRRAGEAGTSLSVAGLNGITLYEPGALTLVVQAGTPLAEIEAALASENQRLAFEPMDHRAMLGTDGTPTIGGVVAANVSGPRRVQVGACRDFLLGVRFVDGRGTIVRNGGRVMKNVTGYDLVKLMAGSWGSLGVLSEVSLKVLPRPECEATLRVSVPNAETAVRVLSAGLGSPFEVSGAAYDPALGEALVRIEGFAAQVSYRVEKLRDLLGAIGAADTVDYDEKSVRAWAGVRDVTPFAGQPGDVWRISVKPTDAPLIAAGLRADGLLFDWGGGLIWARVPEGTDLRARIGVFAGHATLVRSSVETRVQLGQFQAEPAPLAALSRGLRDQFDPKHLFNPGLMDSPVEA